MNPRRLGWALLLAALALAGCSEVASERKVEAPGDDNLTPAQLTGIPSLDEPPKLSLQVLYARGTGTLPGQDRPLAPQDPVPAGGWLVSTPGSEFELSFRSGLVADGIVRLGPLSRLLMENPPAGRGLEARFRLYSGQASFFVPPLAQNQIEVVTPSGTLVSPGGAFTVTLSPDFQVLVTCREGSVQLAGRASASAWPGQVFQFGPLGTNRAWTLTPNQALKFQGRWAQVVAIEAAAVLQAQAPQRVAEFRSLQRRFDLEAAERSVVWWTSAKAALPDRADAPRPAELEALWDRASHERQALGGFVGFWVASPSEGLDGALW